MSTLDVSLRCLGSAAGVIHLRWQQYQSAYCRHAGSATLQEVPWRCSVGGLHRETVVNSGKPQQKYH